MSAPSTSRRCRIQARPNIGIPRPLVQAVAKQRPRTVSLSKHHGSGNGEGTHHKTHEPDNQHVPAESVNEDMADSTAALQESRPHSPAKTSFAIANTDVQIKTDESDKARNTTRRRTSSSSTTLSPSKSDSSSKKKKMSGEEPLDPKTMTMYDMIFWNPKNEARMKSKDTDDDQKTNVQDMSVAEWEKTQEEEKRKAEAAKAVLKVAAPQVKIAADGSLIVDESSLTVVNDTSSSIWETVNEGGTGRRVTSTSFRKKTWRKGTAWSELETQLFYDILRATGPDFGLMHEFFSSRTRAELKSKFNREERSHWDRISKAMAVPTQLSESLFEHAKQVLERIGQEKLDKKEKRMSKKMKALQHKEEDESSEQGEGPSQKEVKIKVVKPTKEHCKKPRKKPQNKEKQAEGTPRKRAKKKEVIKSKEDDDSSDDEESNTEQDPTTSAMFDKLGRGFPRFKMFEDCDAEGVSLERRNDGRPPVVKVPLNTKLTAYPEDKAQPERILFICPAKNSNPPTKFLIQQRIAVADPPSGFLHLFGPPK